MEEIRGFLKDAGAWPLVGYIPASSASYARQPGCRDATLGNISYVPVDDDVSYTVTALRLVEEHGRDFTQRDVCRNWLQNLPYGCLYSCTKQAYYSLINASHGQAEEDLIAELPLKVNPMREGLNASIRIDLFGFISPADPLAAIRMAHRNATVNSVKNGVYAATFVASCIAAALSGRPTVQTILDAGLAAIPKRSRPAEAISLTRQWYAESGGEWEPVCERIFARWGHINWAGAMLNYPLVVLALLHGNLDFGKTICTAVMCGIDTDCTAGTLGGIVGAAVGRRGIDRSWYDPFNDTVRTFVAGNGGGDGTISDLVRRTVQLAGRTA
jgi:ADP-ribosylglycohydrolase